MVALELTAEWLHGETARQADPIVVLRIRRDDGEEDPASLWWRTVPEITWPDRYVSLYRLLPLALTRVTHSKPNSISSINCN